MASSDIENRLSAIEVSDRPKGAEAQLHFSWSEWLSGQTIKVLIYVIGDVTALILGQSLAAVVAAKLSHAPEAAFIPSSHSLFYVPFCVAALHLFGAYRRHDLRRPEKELEITCTAATVSFAVWVAAIILFSKASSAYFLLFWYGFSVLLLLIARFGIRGIYGALWNRGLALQRTVLIGTPSECVKFRDLLQLQRHKAFKILGVLVPSSFHGRGAIQQNLPVLGTSEQYHEVVSARPVDLVVLCSASLARELAAHILAHGSRGGRVEIEIYSGVLEGGDLDYERDEFSGLLRVQSLPHWARRVRLLAKEILDRLFGLVGSVIVLLIAPFVAVVIKLEDRGPIFYRSAYLGQDGKLHYYLKFRSMCQDADHVLARSEELRKQFDAKHKLICDPRVTRVGRFLRKYSIDELPQFFSVLLGKLSLVGPRTIRREEGAKYGELLPKLLSFKPGVTGFWQVMGRQTTTYAERVHMDMFYIDHWSIWLDLVIIAKTVWMTIKAEGAY